MTREQSQTEQQNCMKALVDMDTAVERLYSACASASYMRSYRDRFHELERCGTMGRQLAEISYMAERHLRIILKVGLDSVNDLMDSGRMKANLLELIRERAAGNKNPFEEALKGTPKALREQFVDLDTSFFQDAIEINRGLGLVLRPQKASLEIHFKTAEGRDGHIIIEPNPRPGDLGRVSSRQFFGRGQGTFAALRDSTVIGDDCHHRKQGISIGVSERAVDVYGGILSTFATAREAMYRHVRIVDELGSARIRGNDVVITPWLVAVIIGTVLLASGATISVGCDLGIWDKDSKTCKWGSALTTSGSIILLVNCAVAGGLQCIKGVGVSLKDFLKIPGTK